MTITAYPFENQDTSEVQYSLLFRELADTGIADTFGGPGWAVKATGTGMAVTVAPGFAIVRGHAVTSTATETRTIAAAGNQPRIDRVVLRLDPAQNTIALVVVQGVPGAGPATLTTTDTGVYELSLAQVRVDTGVFTITADKVTDERVYIGSHVGAWTTDTRPTAPRTGRLGLNTAAGRWEFWNGTTWTDFAPVVAWNTIGGKPATFPPAAHRHPWNDLDSVPTSFTPATHTHSFNAVTDKPSSYPPDGHSHGAGDINSGRLSIDRVPVGGDSASVSRGDHNHDGRYSGAGHGHGTPGYATRSDGSDRVHPNTPANGSGTWYSVWVDGNHNFCHNTSSIRFKTNVRDHDIDPSDVLALRPVLFDRKATTDSGGTVQPGPRNEFGLIAEEVDQHVPELTVRDEDGRIEAVRYDLLPVALLSVVTDQQARIEKLENQITGLQTVIKVLAGEGTAGGE